MGDRQSNSSAEQLRKLPQVERLAGSLPEAYPAPLRVEAARAAVSGAKEEIESGLPAPSFEALASHAEDLLTAQKRTGLVRVVNATGVLLHTNLGRAPLGEAAISAIEEMTTGYSNLEYELATASRGSRYDRASGLLKALTGAEDALVVNNNAAAVLLCLSGLARGKEAIVSRGELIEIGGEFRIPDIMALSEAVMTEVGTTNRTHLRDYEKAVGPETGAIVKVHPSNYQVVGFSSSVPGADLAALAHGNGAFLINDLGSGLLRRQIGGRWPSWLAQEPCVSEAVAEGADAVAFSGDKLLGGPQAGIIVGKSDAIARIQRSPLLRAFRVDKTTLAALEATLTEYLAGREADLPLWRMALLEPEELERRARAVAALLEGADAKVDVVDGFSTPGGGSAPGTGIPTALLEISPARISARGLFEALVAADPPVVARIEEERVLLDLRTVEESDDAVVAASLIKALS